MMVKLIAHVLVHSGDDYLLIQRSEIKRGQPNVYPTYWDIPGGGVENDMVVVDPVLGDNGRLYKGITEEMVSCTEGECHFIPYFVAKPIIQTIELGSIYG